MYGYGSDPMPVDKLMKLFIIQSISAFVANDYDSGVHFLTEIKQAYAENMSKLNPTLKQLAKEIIQSVDLFKPDGSAFMGGAFSQPQEPMGAAGDAQPEMPSFDVGEEEAAPAESTSVASELQELLNRRRANRKR